MHIAFSAALLRAKLFAMQGKVQQVGQEGCRNPINDKHVAVGAVSFLPFNEAIATSAGEGAAGQAGLVATTVENSYMVNLGKQSIAQVGSILACLPCPPKKCSTQPRIQNNKLVLQGAIKCISREHVLDRHAAHGPGAVYDTTAAILHYVSHLRGYPTVSVRQSTLFLQFNNVVHVLHMCNNLLVLCSRASWTT